MKVFVEEAAERALSYVHCCQTEDGGYFANPNNLYVEVTSEFEELFEGASVLVHLGIPFDRHKTMAIISSLLNRDGGFGWQGRSSLTTTYYALQTVGLLAQKSDEPERVLSFLDSYRPNIQFLEDLFHLAGVSKVIGGAWPLPEGVLSFVLHCQRSSGGFRRGGRLGIATLEYTYYAISILEHLKAI